MNTTTVALDALGGLDVVGVGAAHGHHGEFLQGEFTDENRTVRALVTVPYPRAFSRAIFRIDPDLAPGEVRCRADRRKSQLAAALALAHLGAGVGGVLEVSTFAIEEFGMGTSTTDATAAVRAVADALGWSIPPATIAGLVVEAEEASDPLMFDGVMAFAHREGRVLRRLADRLPPLRIVSVRTGAGVDTQALRPAPYDLDQIAQFDELLDEIHRGVREGDAAAIGRVSTESARINQANLPVAAFDDLVTIADDTGATGVQVAHSGSLAGVLFDDRCTRVARHRAARARQFLEELGLEVLDEFVLHPDPKGQT